MGVQRDLSLLFWGRLFLGVFMLCRINPLRVRSIWLSGCAPQSVICAKVSVLCEN